LRAIAAEISDSAVDVFVYDTSRDSDGGAWRKRTQHTSWYNEELNTETRGGRREFPAVAVIVAEANKVTIYDGDDPDLSMWMVFNQGGSYVISNNLIGATTASNSAITCLNGILSLTTSTEAIYIIKFISDKSQRVTNSAHREYLGGIGERNSGKGLSQKNSTNYIVNTNCNDVAMTILPNAPIDEDTGLPVPTIAVATDGGVSVIKDDGTVVDITNTQSDPVYRQTEHITFTKDYKIRFTMDSTQQRSYWTLDIPDFDYAIAHWQPNKDNGITFYENDVYGDFAFINADNPITAIEAESLGNGSGLTLFDENKAEPKKSIVAYVNSKYNTGWMPGDIKLATLSDTTVETIGVNSDELLTNGDFKTVADGSVGYDNGDGTVDGWTSIAGAQLSISNNNLKVEHGGTNNARTSISIQTIVGKQYALSAEVIEANNSSNTGRIYFSDATGNSYSVDVSNGNIGMVNFTARHQETLIILNSLSNGDGTYVIFDNVSVRATTELITNGDFSNGTTGWTAVRGTISDNNGVLQVSQTTEDQAYAYQDIDSFVVGKKYTISYELRGVDTTGNMFGMVQDLASNTELISREYVSSGANAPFVKKSHSFVASSDNLRVFFMINTASDNLSLEVDNISVRPAVDDRSVNNNGLQIVGEINKTPVAPGADLVAYSGFTSGDYGEDRLEQPYNSDLAFGAGDFCISFWVKNLTDASDMMGVGKRTVDAAWTLYKDAAGGIRFTASWDGISYATMVEAQMGNNSTLPNWTNVAVTRSSGVFNIYVDGTLRHSNNAYTTQSFYATTAPLVIGSGNTNNAVSTGLSFSLLRISKTAPTPDQIAKIYHDEKVLFQDGAQATLYGSSDAVTALAYDDSNQLLHVGTASGRSDFRGLVRVNNTTTAISNSISAAEGTIIQN